MSRGISYLCGPINGCTDAQCNDWRDFAKHRLHDHLDPMRRDYRGKEEECYREIVDLDKIDVRASDFIIANCHVPSAGTSMEVFMSWQIGKPVVTIVPDMRRASPWLRYHSTKMCTTIAEAVAWINAL